MERTEVYRDVWVMTFYRHHKDLVEIERFDQGGERHGGAYLPKSLDSSWSLSSINNDVAEHYVRDHYVRAVKGARRLGLVDKRDADVALASAGKE